MTTATLTTSRSALTGQPARRGELALALQEAFTVAVRLRAGRQAAADATSFRAHVKQLLATADAAARRAGYDAETTKLAVYAYIALLDESVLNSSQPLSAEWARRPLQEEVFGEHMAGDTFFRTLSDLMGRQDSEALADLLEVFLLCLLLGFHGRYGGGETDTLLGLRDSVRRKIERIRGDAPELAPDGSLPTVEAVTATRDPMARRLAVIAATTAGVALLLFLVYWALLHSGVADLQSLV